MRAIYLIMTLALARLSVNASATAPEPPQTIQRPDGTPVSEKELVKIFVEHFGRLKKGEKHQLNFAKWKLEGVQLGEILKDAAQQDGLVMPPLNGINFSGANLTGASLARPDAILERAETSVTQRWAVFPNERLFSLRRASFDDAVLTDAIFTQTDFTGATFQGATLVRTRFIASDLVRATFTQANIQDAVFCTVNLSRAVFAQPYKNYPDLGWLSTNDLTNLTYEYSEAGLVEFQNDFRSNGLRDAERQVTFALERQRTRNLWFGRQRSSLGDYETSAGDRIEAAFRKIFFDWVCGYGLYFGRPLEILLILMVILTIPYLVAVRSATDASRARIWLMGNKEAVLPEDRQSQPVLWSDGESTREPVHLGRAWLAALGTAFYFSMMSAFRIGFRELNVGTWLGRIHNREYSYRATGWVRVLSGLQSLASVYLVALWALSYFGRPFE